MSTGSPKVSIIVPVYRVEKYLRQCVDSLLAQTYTNIEIFLVDDCSDDLSGQICDEYAKKNEIIRVIHLPENKGLSGARNAALLHAAGEYLAFVDSDDAVSPTYVADFMNAFSQYPAADVAQCAHVAVQDDDDITRIQFPPQNFSLKYYANQEVIDALYGAGDSDRINFTVWNKLFKRSAVAETVFAERMLCEDVIFSSEVFLNGASLVCADRQNYYYRQRSSSIMGDLRADKDKLILRHCLAYSYVANKFGSQHGYGVLITARLGIWYTSAIKSRLLFRNKALKKIFADDSRSYCFFKNGSIPAMKRFWLRLASLF